MLSDDGDEVYRALNSWRGFQIMESAWNILRQSDDWIDLSVDAKETVAQKCSTN
jgi:hypothetical protein